MAKSFANDTCSVEVYPFKGGPVSLQGGQIKSVTVRKSLRGVSEGTAQVELAPGGPRGTEDPNTWSQIITPQSHMLIGMSRGDDSKVVFDGVVSTVGEAQQWHNNASRGQGFSGKDFTYFFRSFNWFALTFYGLMAGGDVGNALDYIPAGMQQILSQALIGGGSPVTVGRVWFDKVMAGNQGILGKTFVPFMNGSRYSFTKCMAALFEEFTTQTFAAFIPQATYFMTTEGSWAEKFQTIFPEPWYEFFVTTAPSGAYNPASGTVGTNEPGGFNGVTEPGTQFQMPTMKYAVAAGPQLVARVNPVPQIKVNVSPSGNTFGDIDTTRWNGLPLFDYTKQGFGFIESNVEFSAEGAMNFYQLNPTIYNGLVGVNNGNNIPVAFLFPSAADAASIQRYGFRPYIGTTQWFSDPYGQAAAGNQDVIGAVVNLTGFMVSWAHPRPLMLDGTITMPLAPQALIGTRFRYAPFKDGTPWDFYIEAYKHRFVFGGRSTTTLTLSRGLPTSVYQNTTSGGVLRALHIGNAMRQNGQYVVGLPDGTGPALQFVPPSQAGAFNQLISNVPNTPQWTGTGAPPA